MSGIIPSPNIWEHPDVYEVENLGVDRAGVIETAMRSVRDWAGSDVLDIGCGTGFHLPMFARSARSVVGVEPYTPLAELARDRIARTVARSTSPSMPLTRLAPVRVLECGAGSLELPAASIDVAHARWAYFFGPGCEPGLAELARVLRPGGTAFVIDNDPTRSSFGSWFRREHPGWDATAVERFWRRQGWTRVPLMIEWTFDSRADFESVVRIEFAPEHADLILHENPAVRGIDYAVNLWHRTTPTV